MLARPACQQSSRGCAAVQDHFRILSGLPLHYMSKGICGYNRSPRPAVQAEQGVLSNTTTGMSELPTIRHVNANLWVQQRQGVQARPRRQQSRRPGQASRHAALLAQFRGAATRRRAASGRSPTSKRRLSASATSGVLECLQSVSLLRPTALSRQPSAVLPAPQAAAPVAPRCMHSLGGVASSVHTCNSFIESPPGASWHKKKLGQH